MSQPKILHVAALDRTIHKFRLPLINRLRSLGLETWVTCSPGEYVSDIEEAGHKFVPLPISRRLSLSSNSQTVASLVQLMRRERFDLVHTHTPIAGALGRIAATLTRVPTVFHTTGGWYFHEHMPRGKRQLFVNIERQLAKRTDVIFSVNREDMETASELNITPRQKIVYSGPAGVNLEQFDPSEKTVTRQQMRKKLEISEQTFVIGLVARHVWEKGVREFLQVAQNLVDQTKQKLVFLMIGDGPRTSEIHEMIAEKQLGNHVRILGRRNDVPEIMQAIDLYLFPSYREGVPVSVQEAMAASVPVVAFKIRGCREAVIDGKTGYLLPFQDTDAMTVACLHLINNADLRMQFGKNGRLHVSQEYTQAAHVERQIPAYQTILDRLSNTSNPDIVLS